MKWRIFTHSCPWAGGLTQFVWNGFTQHNCIELWSHSPHTDARCLIENMKKLGAYTRTHGHLDHKNYQLSLIFLSPVRRKYYEANISLATCPFTAQWLLIKGELKPNLTQWNPIKCVMYAFRVFSFQNWSADFWEIAVYLIFLGIVEEKSGTTGNW